MRWNLDSLYTAFDSNEYKNDLNTLNSLIDEIKTYAENNFSGECNDGSAVQRLEEFIKLLNKLEGCQTLAEYASLVLSVDTDNDNANKMLDILEDRFTETTVPLTKFNAYIARLDDLDGIIEQSPYLKEHEFFLKEIKEESKYLLSENEEKIISKMKNTSSSAWSKQYEQLSSTLTVDMTIDGEPQRLPLSKVRNLAYSPKPEVRRDAYNAELSSYEKIARPVANSLNNIKSEVITLCNLRGYN